jgi:superfamily I DNA/RNA helicase
MTLKPKVALSKEFLAAYSRLPVGIQKKVREFTEKFQQDPTQPGLNFERLHDSRDDKVRSVRIDQAYRAIVVQPPKGDVFLCVWVDRHDDAYAWVRNKRFDVNPTSGVLQLYEVESHKESLPPPKPAPAPRKEPKLFEEHDDEALMLAGVPQPLLPSVRALRTDNDLDAIKPHLPEDAAEVLYALAAGMALPEALAEVERAAARKLKVDVTDFAAAMAQPATQRQFKLVDGDAELSAMLDKPLQQWRIFLHPTQKKLVTMAAKGPMRVLGGAGTGKTVVMMHRARHLALQMAPGRKVLVTTFTRNLAGDLAQNLRELCGNEFANIEVVNLHAWAMQFLTRQGVKFTVLAAAEERHRRMDQAVDEVGAAGLPHSFFLEEWDRVVLAQEILDREAYLQARRTGRGTRVDRRLRSQVWDTLARYRQGLQRDGLLEWQDVVREARLLLQSRSIKLPYGAVCADEVQDFSPSELMLLRALVPPGQDDLFLVGDGHQRIYGQPVVLSRCGIDVRGRGARLKLNYRTTDRIAKQGMAILANCAVDDLDGETDSLKGYTSLRAGVEPEQHLFASQAEEVQFVVRKVRQWLDAGAAPETVCVAARTNNAVKNRYRAALEADGFPCTVIDNDADKGLSSPGVRISTMHRMKGLEFPRVLLASVQDGMVPLRKATSDTDAEIRADHVQQERCLLYVACTRARDELVVAGYGKACPFLSS